jgi:hypothetical protein
MNYSAIANLSTSQITRPRSILALRCPPCTLLYSSVLSLSLMLTTDGQSASLSWNKAPIRGLPPDFYYCQSVEGLLMWGALSDERMGLSFTIAAGPRQRSHSRVRVPWESRPYFTVSDLRLPFSSPPTTRRAMVEVSTPLPHRHGPHGKHSLLSRIHVYWFVTYQ